MSVITRSYGKTGSGKVGRNDPCPCGSGKKYKKCCIQKKERQQYVYLGFKEKPHMLTAFPRFTQMAESGEDILTSEFIKMAQPDHVFTKIEYPKDKGGSKATCVVPGRAIINVNRYLAKNFDLTFAIDTNTKQIENDHISIAVVLEAKAVGGLQNEIAELETNISCFGFKNCPIDQSEKYSWIILIRDILSGLKYKGLQIALITDHDKDNHSNYNSRRLPIVGDYLLPGNVTLMYASSDSGKDNIMNELMRECEKQSRDLLLSLEKNGFLTFYGNVVHINKIPNAKI
jgi:hypothetical protein